LSDHQLDPHFHI